MRFVRFLILLAAICLCGNSTFLYGTVPSGLSENVIASGLSVPTSLEIAPDGRVFVTQQDGTIWTIKDDVLQEQPFARFNVRAVGEQGLVGITLDPNFATNHYVYIYYTANEAIIHNRLSRVTASGDQMLPGSEVALLDLPDVGTAIWHVAGALRFGPDGKLYISVGDHQNSALAQSLNAPTGKILRLNPDGSIPPDNPFYNQTSGSNRAIWAYGLRNPFTSAFQPGSGRFFINDVGQDMWEEIDEGVSGANYGWPTTEGDFNQSTYPNFRRPFLTYSHAEGCAITGGDFYNPSSNQFGASYSGKYFYADYCSGWIRVLDPATKAVSTFATNLAFPINLRVSRDGSLYYVTRGADSDPAGKGSVWKVQNPLNQVPTIYVHPQSQIVANGAAVTFSVSASGTAPLTYRWQRNGIDIPGANAASYSISTVARTDDGSKFRVIISNNLGTVTSQEATLTVPLGGPPAASITLPEAGTLYTAGDTISFQGNAVDPDEGNLSADKFTWVVNLHHHTHTHPFMPATSGITAGSFKIPTTGETDEDVWYRISLTVRDSTGLTQTVQRDVFPHKATITLATDPPGLAVKVDGQPTTTTASILGVVGMTRSLGAYAQSSGGIGYDFDSWSDGGSALHDISFPATDTTYTARYRSATFVSDLNWVGTPTNGWGPAEKDQSNGEQPANDGRTIKLRGLSYAKGLGVHAYSEVTYDLGARYSRFISDIGVDDETNGPGTVIFQVWLDGVKTFESPVLTGTSAIQSVNISVANKKQLKLIVTNAGDNIYNDHSDWAGARLLPVDNSPPPTPTPTVTPTATPTPTPTTTPGSTPSGSASLISQSGWTVQSVDSQETVGENAAATKAFDGNPNTFWHTQWYNVNPPPPPPHQISINLGNVYTIAGFRYLPRQDYPNGRIGQYEFNVSADANTWTTVAVGTFPNTTQAQDVFFPAVAGCRYIQLRALSEVNGQPWTSIGEINVFQAGTTPTQSPSAAISTPSGDVAIAPGSTINFTATASDPDANLPLTYRWSFGAGSGIIDSVVKDPGQVQFNKTGTFVVTFTVTDSLGASTQATRTVTVQSLLPTLIPQTGWTLKSVDSQEIVGEKAPATNAFDGSATTFWHTQWYNVNPIPSVPHQISINLGALYNVAGFRYLPRQDFVNGRIAQYQFYLSLDGTNWGSPVAAGIFANSTQSQDVFFPALSARYIQLKALSEVNGRPYTSIGELNVYQSTGPVTTPTPTPTPSFSLIGHVGWTLQSVDSQELVAGNFAATKAFDGDPNSFWHTQWYNVNPTPPLPHQISINLGNVYTIGGFRYLPRQDYVNGRIARYEFKVSADANTWTTVATGTFPNSTQRQDVFFPAVAGCRYIQLRALSEVNGRAWTSVGEIDVFQPN